MATRKTNVIPTYRISLLKSQIYRAMNAYLTRVLKPYSLSPPEWSLLGAVYESKSLQPTEISEMLGVKPPVVTSLLRKLETKGLLNKSRHAEDSRYSTVVMTEAGQQALESAEGVIQKDLKNFTKGIDQSDLENYVQILERIAAKLRH